MDFKELDIPSNILKEQRRESFRLISKIQIQIVADSRSTTRLGSCSYR